MFAIAGGIILAVFFFGVLAAILENLEEILQSIADGVVWLLKASAFVACLYVLYLFLSLFLSDQVILSAVGAVMAVAFPGYLIFCTVRGIYRLNVARHEKKVTVSLVRSTAHQQRREQPL